MYGSVCSKGGHQHFTVTSSTTSNTRNHPAGEMQTAGEHASSRTANKLPAGFWWTGEAFLHLTSLHSPGARL